MKRLLAGAALLLAMAGCDHLLDHRAPPVYAPWIVGQTLIFSNPSLPGAQKLQVRVARVDPSPGGLLVKETFTTVSTRSEAVLRLDRGMVAMTQEGSGETTILPEGFPDKVSRWMERGAISTVIGRARVDLPGVHLPDPDAVGVWVETVPFGPGQRLRSLVVPDFGIVEKRYWKDGQWVLIYRLVSQGYTDPPEHGSAQ